jgi:hypothetical protein
VVTAVKHGCCGATISNQCRQTASSVAPGIQG